jgi:adenylate kinase
VVARLTVLEATMPTSTSHKYQAILLFGMPGSGKGTQGAVLDQLPGFVHIASGELFRKLPRWGTLGREVLQYTSKGALVPDELTVKIYKRHLQLLEMQELLLPREHVLVLDGLPRNYAQAQILDEMIDVVQIFHLEIQEIAGAIDRLRARALRENRLDDTNEDVILKRIKVYNEETYATLAFYDPRLVTEIDAAGTPLAVHCTIVDRLLVLEKQRRIEPMPESVGDDSMGV